MAGESCGGFHVHQQHQLQQGMLFKSGGSISSSGSSSSGSAGCQLIPMGRNYYRSPGSGGSLILSGSDGAAAGRVIFSPQNSLDSSSAAIPMDSGGAAGLRHDTGLAVEWSIDEQFKLEEGLAKYANEPAIMQYIKIAATLRDKTVRDVAFRCSWMMMRKRRKQEDMKKIKSRKEKMVESSLKNSISSSSSVNVVPYALPRSHHEKVTACFPELQQNVELFLLARNNITTILNNMSNMPGIMSRMPPLPVILNEELASSIFPCSQPMIFSSSSAIPLKPEPGY